VTERAYAHFIGIGGAGMSGLALVLRQRGVTVTGSDLKDSRYARLLRDAGVSVIVGHAAENLGDPELVVVSSAIPDYNPELVAARERGIEVWPRARMLAELAQDRCTVAVAGTHGKTTTSSMVATMLAGMGLEPSFLIGGEVDGFSTNAAHGAGRHYVVEADESDGSFVYLTPHVALITNVEADHLDHYAGIEEIEATFAEFCARVTADGVLVACGDDARLLGLAQADGRRVITYGAGPACDVRYRILGRSGIGFSFEVSLPGETVVTCATKVPGEHMVSNACGALATAVALGLDVEAAAAALAGFTGVRRRFDRVAEVGGVTIVDDYAHHPTELRATLGAAKGLGFRRVWALFQPHRYSRTAAFGADFGAAFGDADRVVMMDVYSAGETPIPGVTGKTIVDATLAHNGRSQVTWLPHRADIVPYLSTRVAAGDLVLTMGAGDVTQLGPELARALEARVAEGRA